MNIGSVITCNNNSKYKVIKELKTGGQGSVYMIETVPKTPKKYCLKIINEKKEILRNKKIENIKKLKDDSHLQKNSLMKNFNIALPLAIYEKNGEFGYVMNWYPGREIGDMMIDKCFDSMKLEKKINIVHKLAESGAWLRGSGYCYQDFSHGNFLYDEKNDVISVIDVDNLTSTSSSSSGEACFAKGTSFYIAPEVAFGQCNPSTTSDDYALATLFYKIMTGSTTSPYHGKELYSKNVTPGNMLDAAFYTSDDPDYGYDWLTFVFDKDTTINEVDLSGNDKKFIAEGKKIIKNWNEVPSEMKELFYLAFKDPLDAVTRKQRPYSKKWLSVTDMKNLKNSNVPLSNPKKDLAPICELEKGARVSLPNGKIVDVINEFEVLTSKGFPFGTIKKDEDQYIFISNTMYTLKMKLSKEYKDIKSKESVVLEKGMEIYITINYDEKIKVISIN